MTADDRTLEADVGRVIARAERVARLAAEVDAAPAARRGMTVHGHPSGAWQLRDPAGQPVHLFRDVELVELWAVRHRAELDGLGWSSTVTVWLPR